jgi:phosphatidylglycerol:prolipoprotein diacylglycerol transferase
VLAAISYKPIPIFELGPLSLSLHGLFAGLGFAAGGYWMIREARRRRFDPDRVVSVLTWGLVGSILGARLFTVPAHLADAGYGLSEIVSITGDYSILGGYAGGIIAGAIRMRMVKASVSAHMDMAAAGLAIGAVVGRIGDLAIVEHLGSPTSFFLGYTLKPNYDVSPQHNTLEQLCRDFDQCGPWHHTALYDLIGAAVLLGVIVLLQRLWVNRRYGQMFSFWMVWYGVQRFLIDFTRLDAARDGVVRPDGVTVETIADSVMGPFTGSQWGGLGTAALGVLLLLWTRRYRQVSAEADAELREELEPVVAGAATASLDEPADPDPPVAGEERSP